MRECDTCIYAVEIDKGIIEEYPGADSELRECPYYIEKLWIPKTRKIKNEKIRNFCWQGIKA